MSRCVPWHKNDNNRAKRLSGHATDGTVSVKKILIGVFAITVIAVAGALVAPSFIDWNAYRSEIATEVRKATGRKLTIDGAIDVALLPVPRLSVAKVRLANLDGAHAPDMARFDALDVRIALWPLLSGKVEVSSVELRGADIELEALTDGRVNWDFRTARKGESGTPSSGGGEGVANAVRLDQVVISRGRLSYRDSRKNTIERIEAIDARLAADTLAGPFVLRGRANLRGVPMAVEARLGRLSDGHPTPLTATLELTGARTKADITGRITTGAEPRADLTIQAAGDDLAATIGALTGGGAGPRLLARKFSLEASVAGDSRAVAVNNLALVINDTRVTGAVNARLGTVPQVDATFAVNTMNLDNWLTAAAASGTSARTPADGGTGQGAPGPATGAGPGGFVLPDDVRVAFNGRIGGVTYRKGVVRDVVVQGGMERGVVNVSRFAAVLPGGTDVTGSGRFSTPKGVPRFDGRIDASTADLRVLLDWAGIDHRAIAADRLHKASLRAGLGYGPERLDLRDIDLRFDSTRIGGGVVIALRERIGLGATIVVDSLNLDAYTAAPVKGAPVAKPPKSGKGQSAGTGDGGLSAFDANVRLRVGQLTAQGMALKGLTLDGSLIRGNLTVTSLKVADLAGGKLEVSGKITGLDRAPIPDLRFSLSTGAPDKLLALAGLSTSVPAAKLRPFALDGAFKSEARTTRLDAKMSAGALRVGLKGTVADLATAPRVGLALDASHPNYVEFVRLFLPDFTPRVDGKGPFSLAARAEGAGLDVRLTSVAARFGTAQVTGDATLALAAVRPKLTANFKAGAIIAEHFIPDSVDVAPERAGAPGKPVAAPSGSPWSDVPLDLDALRGFDADVKIEGKTLDWRAWRVNEPRIELNLADGRFDLRRVSGKTVGGTFLAKGGLAAPVKKGGAAELKADIDISRADLAKAMFNATDLDLAKGTVTFRMNLAGKGVSSRALVSSLAGAGNLEAVNGAISGFDLGRVNERLKNLNQPTAFLGLLQAAMSGGTTTFSKFGGTFRIEKGVLRSDDIVLVADGGSGQGTLVADLPKWQINADSMFRLSGHKDAPPFRMALKGPLDQPRRVFNVNELQAWMVSKGAGALIEQLTKKKKPQDQGGTAPSTQSQPAQPKPEEFIRDIFELLKKK
ncbi:MAG: AsmA family protein [Alphaproteobacteria bacterium]|nr:AsmA family protein [Alphaproteobacteria bacterium]